jgi:hypothetical protein
VTAKLESAARGKVWGSDEVNVEGWKPLKRLPGHESGRSAVAFVRSFFSDSRLFRCDGCCVVSWGSLPCFSGAGFEGHNMVWIHAW